MAIEKIKYKNKVAIKNDESLPEINKVTDENMNEIKKVINNNADELSLIKNQIPTGQATGNPIHIADSTNLEAKLRLNGGDKQETREGSNYFNINDLVKGMGALNLDEEDFVTVTVDNSSGSSQKYYNVYTNPSKLIKPNTKYYLVLEVKEITGTGNIMVHSFNATDHKPQFSGSKNYGFANLVAGDIKIDEITSLEDFSDSNSTLRTFLSYNAGQSGSITFRISVLEEEPTVESFVYEKYGAMPSPGYPSKIETVGSNINLFDKDNANTISGAYVDSSGNIGNGGANSQTLYIPITGGKTYTVSKKATSYGTFRIGTTAEVPALNVQGIDVVSKNGTDTSATITTSSNAKYLTIFCIRTDFDNMQEILESLKIEEGNKTTPYSPYNMGSVEIDVVNKNLFDKDNAKKINAIINGQTKQIASFDNCKTAYINCLKNTTYTISRKIGTRFIVGTTTEIPNNGIICNQAIQNNISDSITITTAENDNYLSIFYYNGATDTLTEQEILDSIQIELGETATEKVEPQSQTKIMPIQQEMLEGDYIEDVEHHTWNKVSLLGQDNWNYNFYQEKENTIYFVLEGQVDSGVTATQIAEAMCNRLSTVYTANTLWNNDSEGFALQGNSLRVRINKSLIPNWNSDGTYDVKNSLLRAYLKENNYIFYYKRATPLDLELTEEQKEAKKINAYKNVTNIAVDNNLATLDVTYKKDQNTVNKNYENRIAALEAAILS